MRPLRYSINVSLDGCVDHASPAFTPDEELHHHAADWLARHDVGLFGRVTYQLMEAWRPGEDGRLGDWMAPWMEPFAHTIGDLPKVVVSSALRDPGWNTEVVDGADLESVVQALKDKPGRGIALGGVRLALPLAQAGLIDEYQLVVHPKVAGRGPRLFEGLTSPLDLRLVDRTVFASGVAALVYVPAA